MQQTKIAFCIVDDINTYANDEIQTTIRNICDFTISNLHVKGYDAFVDKDEDKLLRDITDYDYAVVMSPGTEYINGYAFFEALEELVKKDFFIAGHILDRTMHDAYYELHHQCYVINMAHYRRLQSPAVGEPKKGVSHTQLEPTRSTDTWHEDYTPKFVYKGTHQQGYTNRCHGWNLLRLTFENDLPVIVFDERIRNNKMHYYPESEKDFYKQAEYIKHKFEYCKEQFVHTNNTEWKININEIYDQLVLPASGLLYLDLIKQGTVIFYDYNQCALDYWRIHCPRKENIEYKFVKTNLLDSIEIVDHINHNLKTLVNLSNIFCYEGTAAFYSLKHRLNAQNKLVNELNKFNNITVILSTKADAGHLNKFSNL
jgi:hypothetical protein